MREDRSLIIRALRLWQPIGEFFLVVMRAQDLVAVSYADVRKLERHELDRYMGINRRLSSTRVKDLRSYVRTYDATFPTSIILAVSAANARYDEEGGWLELFAAEGQELREIGKIIDGQHRIAGLEALEDRAKFELGVAIFVGADIATQANIFATVNLAQTKVNRSLAYDLFDYEKVRSPQKSAHYVAVALDQIEESPFFRRIKRLGKATEGREGETITQAVVVEMLLGLMSSEPMTDRDAFLRKLGLKKPTVEELRRHPFRGLFVEQNEEDIARILLRYFGAVQDRWPGSWNDLDRAGNALPKTNGFRALMRFLRAAYLAVVGEEIGSVPNKGDFERILGRVELEDGDFNTVTFPPGTSGEAGLYRYLTAALGGRGKWDNGG